MRRVFPTAGERSYACEVYCGCIVRKMYKAEKIKKIFTNKQEFEGAMENIINTNPTDSKPARRKDVSPMAHHGQR